MFIKKSVITLILTGTVLFAGNAVSGGESGIAFITGAEAASLYDEYDIGIDDAELEDDEYYEDIALDDLDVEDAGYIAESKAEKKSSEKKSSEDRSFNPVRNFIICLVIGLVIALIAVGSMKAKLKTVHRRNEASDYLKKDSMKLEVSTDNFLYKKVNKTVRNNGGK